MLKIDDRLSWTVVTFLQGVVTVYIERISYRRKMESINYTYILKCADGSLYCGWTNRLEQRVKAHNEGKGAKYTRARRPVVLAYYEEFATKEEAMRREAAIKKLPRKDKLKLLSYEPVHKDIVTEASAHDK